MLDSIIVGLIVAVAAVYIVRRFIRNASSSGGSCGCSGCGSNCSASQKQDCSGK